MLLEDQLTPAPMEDQAVATVVMVGTEVQTAMEAQPAQGMEDTITKKRRVKTIPTIMVIVWVLMATIHIKNLH